MRGTSSQFEVGGETALSRGLKGKHRALRYLGILEGCRIALGKKKTPAYMYHYMSHK